MHRWSSHVITDDWPTGYRPAKRFENVEVQAKLVKNKHLDKRSNFTIQHWLIYADPKKLVG